MVGLNVSSSHEELWVRDVGGGGFKGEGRVHDVVVLELWFNIILALNDGDFLLCGDDDDDDDDGCGGVDDDSDGDFNGRGSDGANNDDKGDGDDSCFIKIIIKVSRCPSL